MLCNYLQSILCSTWLHLFCDYHTTGKPQFPWFILIYMTNVKFQVGDHPDCSRHWVDIQITMQYLTAMITWKHLPAVQIWQLECGAHAMPLTHARWLFRRATGVQGTRTSSIITCITKLPFLFLNVMSICLSPSILYFIFTKLNN